MATRLTAMLVAAQLLCMAALGAGAKPNFLFVVADDVSWDCFGF